MIIKQFFKFCLVGGTAALINFLIYYGTTRFGQWWYVHSAIIAFLVSACFNFTANKLWTFRGTSNSKTSRQIVKFLIVMVSGLAINTGIIFILTEEAKINYLISWVVATGLVTGWSFSFNRLWTFRQAKAEVNLSEPSI